MFELPDAKRIRREDLFDTESTRHSSPEEDEKAEIQAKLRAKLSTILTVDFDDQDQQAAQDETDPDGRPQQEEPEPPAEPEFEFRLFSTGPAQKVILPPAENERPPGEYDENSGGIVEPRPLSYYIRGELSPEQKEQFASAAIDASDILKGARQRAWGLELPWRVVKITVTDQKGDDNKPAVVVVPGKTTGKKKKLNKKGRIASRTKHKAALELEKAKMTKEEHLKEKKKRLNREKKLKRRQKEREMRKLAGGGGGGGEEAYQGDDGANNSMSEGED
ncbi:hypothetical protein QBC37DRAFT_368262 [Rhypophila decipiens]|uniref:Uncharacterized protein n=1 Tax=Rhypophila decipiens TaxID=261697 RepID=A0AAN7BDE4_9PEZI|nr:hypothetical protein QBC37DRAFT_368262 [Rhypophila decipiens]